MVAGKWRPFCLGPSVLSRWYMNPKIVQGWCCRAVLFVQNYFIRGLSHNTPLFKVDALSVTLDPQRITHLLNHFFAHNTWCSTLRTSRPVSLHMMARCAAVKRRFARHHWVDTGKTHIHISAFYIYMYMCVLKHLSLHTTKGRTDHAPR